MNTYIITLKHDGGRFRLQATARTIEAAIELVLASERAPRRAVIGWRKVKV